MDTLAAIFAPDGIMAGLIDWLAATFWGKGALAQYAMLAAIGIISPLLALSLRPSLTARMGQMAERPGLAGSLTRTFAQALPQLIAAFLCGVTGVALKSHGQPALLIQAGLNLSLAWAAARFASALLVDAFWRHLTVWLIWISALLGVAGVHNEAYSLLDSLALTFGEVRLSLITVIKALILFMVLLRIGSWSGNLMDRKLDQSQSLTPSARVLFSKLFRIAVLVVAVAAPLDSLGIKLTALTVFSGAVGVGVGFGMQKVIANFVSGLIILTDKSVRPGDVIEVGGTFGWITDLRARYATIRTRDGKHYLIPNEELITSRVVNWSYGKPEVRLKIDVGVSYDADPRLAMSLMEQAAQGVKRVLDVPPAAARLIDFGDSAVVVSLRFWIADPEKGVANIKSEIMLRIWDLFKEHGIGIPYPQREVTIRRASDGPPSADFPVDGMTRE